MGFVGPRRKEYEADQVIGTQPSCNIAGFQDGHMHTGDAILRGLAQDTNNWMMYGLQPF